jgi:frataxin-like iron-binding protein CyaY
MADPDHCTITRHQRPDMKSSSAGLVSLIIKGPIKNGSNYVVAKVMTNASWLTSKVFGYHYITI